jgi:hypothetical protein
MIAMRRSAVHFWQWVAAAILCSGVTWGQAPVDAATRDSARKLGDEANTLFEAGDFAAALDKYERVDALVHLPAVGLRAARCLVKLGRLIEASERYLAVTRMQLAANALSVHKEAQALAESERAALAPRIASVVITVSGASDAEVTVDGKPVPAALLGASRAIDPGPHKIEGRRGSDVQKRTITAADGETVRVTLTFSGAAPSLPPAGSMQENRRTPPPDATPSHGTSNGTYRILGLSGLGIGAVGLGVGTITGLVAMGKKTDLSANDECGPDLNCPLARHGDAENYNTLRNVSTVGFVAGGVFAAAGAVLFVMSSSGAAKTSARLGVWMGPGSTGVSGTF